MYVRSLKQLSLGSLDLAVLSDTKLDTKLIQFLQAVWREGGVINIEVVRATSNQMQPQVLSSFEMPHSCVHSRTKLTRRAGTASHPPVRNGIYEECRSEYLWDVIQKMKSSVPAELALNADQSPQLTMATKACKSVPIAGEIYLRRWTVAYTGKPRQSQPCGFVFPKRFSITQNHKHWSSCTHSSWSMKS